jgi:hypothetical protein
MPKSGLNAIRSKHSVTVLAPWSPCPCYETNVSVHAPQTLALDLTAATSVTATLANAVFATVTATAIANVAHTFSSRTLAAAAAFAKHLHIAQTIRRHRSQTE